MCHRLGSRAGLPVAALSLPQTDAASELFRALAAPIRLTIVELLTRHLAARDGGHPDDPAQPRATQGFT